jgi:hypothetical protein
MMIALKPVIVKTGNSAAVQRFMLLKEQIAKL